MYTLKLCLMYTLKLHSHILNQIYLIKPSWLYHNAFIMSYTTCIEASHIICKLMSCWKKVCRCRSRDVLTEANFRCIISFKRTVQKLQKLGFREVEGCLISSRKVADSIHGQGIKTELWELLVYDSRYPLQPLCPWARDLNPKTALHPGTLLCILSTVRPNN